LPERTIIVISHVVPCPPEAGNELRIHRLLAWLRGEGYRIVLLVNHAPLPREAREALEATVDRVHFIDDFLFAPGGGVIAIRGRLPKRVQCGVRFLSRLFRYCLLSLTLSGVRRSENRAAFTKRNHCPEKLRRLTAHFCREYQPVAVLAEYIFSTPCLDVVPQGVLRLVDTIDMFSRIQEQVIDHGIPYPLHCTTQEEKGYLMKSDVIIAIQDHEARMFRELVPERPVITVGVDYEVVSDIDSDPVAPNTILLVGSASRMNAHGLLAFIDQAWPAICARVPHAVLRVVGRIGRCLKPGDDRVEIAGVVDDLAAEYRRAALVINPVVGGTGLKIKSVEALCHGKALVTTVNGAEGIACAGEPPFFIAHNWKEFAEAVVGLLENEESRLCLQKRALNFALENFATERVYAPLADILRSRSESSRSLKDESSG
jgi:glycosyltransferase involved in cell wall biosynthesis